MLRGDEVIISGFKSARSIVKGDFVAIVVRNNKYYIACDGLFDHEEYRIYTVSEVCERGSGVYVLTDAGICGFLERDSQVVIVSLKSFKECKGM